MIRTLIQKLKCKRGTLLPLVCALVIMTYVDFFPSVIRYNLSYVAWGVILLECLFTCPLRINRTAFFYIAYGAVFLLIVLIFSAFSDLQYYKSSIVYAILVALLVFICGSLIGNKLDPDDVEVICRWYVLGAVLLSIVLFINTGGDFNLDKRQYLGLNKNSVGQILSSAAMVLMVGVSAKKKKGNTLIRLAMVAVLVTMLFLIRSRTSILCFAVAVVLMLASRYTNRKVKRWIAFAVIVFAVVLIAVPGFRNALVNKILFANRDASDIDALSSGRLTIYNRFFPMLKGNELMGLGPMYYESFFLSAILQFGIPLGLFLWGYVLFMLREVRVRRRSLPYGWLLMLIAVSYSLNGLFEGLPPFGPGTKNFLLWLLFGLATAHTGSRANYEKGAMEHGGLLR
ncbi:MAG: O-antigen ligase family protein [Clostridiales bacterium]|nr:O-antigen ligase family protein [Clostridiales bacterium]